LDFKTNVFEKDVSRWNVNQLGLSQWFKYYYNIYQKEENERPSEEDMRYDVLVDSFVRESKKLKKAKDSLRANSMRQHQKQGITLG